MDTICCVHCKHVFEAEQWVAGFCPLCNTQYEWEEFLGFDNHGYSNIYGFPIFKINTKKITEL